jgi:WD40 repeat protein
MVAVGDSNQVSPSSFNDQVFVYDIGANSYTKTATLTGAKDAGFSCAWSRASDKFAVASQDGVVCVWDVRSSEKLAMLNSKQV